VKVWAVMERDLLRIMRNPFTLLAAVILPLLYLVILGNSLQGPLTRLRLGIVMFDDGPEARTLAGALQAVEHGPRTIELVDVKETTQGMAAVRAGNLSGLLIVPPRFSSDLEHGRAAPVGLVLDNVDAVGAASVQAAVQGAVAAIRQPLARFETRLGGAEVRSEEVYPRVDYDTSLIPGVVVLSIFMGSLIAGAFNLVMDRFLGVHEAYLSTPLRRSDINLGVLLSGTVVTLASSTMVLAVGLLITRARVHGGILGYLAMGGVMVLTALGMLAMMMVVLGRANHPRVTGLVSGFLNIILFFPSGALYPIQSFPDWLRAFARVNPETHAVAALKALLFRGGDVAAAGRHVAFLAVFAAAMLGLSTLTLKRTL
jgi:ABC-2 type transport system permease protein